MLAALRRASRRGARVRLAPRRPRRAGRVARARRALPELPEQLAQLNARGQRRAAGRAAGSAGSSAQALGAVRARARAPDRVQLHARPDPERLRRRDGARCTRTCAAGRRPTLVQYLQRVLPGDGRARPRGSSALATTRAELILEAFDRRQESLARRLEGLLALRDRVEALSRGGARGPQHAGRGRASARRRGRRRRPRRRRRRLRRLREPLPRRARRDPRAPAPATWSSSTASRPSSTSAAAAASSWSCCARRASRRAGSRATRRRSAHCRDRGLDVVARRPASTSCARSRRDRWAACSRPRSPSTCRPRVLQAMLREAHRVLRPGGRARPRDGEPALGDRLPRGLQPRPHPRAPAAPRHAELPGRRRRASPTCASSCARPWIPAAQLQPVPADGLPPRAAAVAERERGPPERAPLRAAGVRADRAAVRAPRVLLARCRRRPPASPTTPSTSWRSSSPRYDDRRLPRRGRPRARPPARGGRRAPPFRVRGAAGRAPYDLAVYQMGNGPAHDFVYEPLVRVPGLLVLHDLVLHHARGRMFLDGARGTRLRPRSRKRGRARRRRGASSIATRPRWPTRYPAQAQRIVGRPPRHGGRSAALRVSAVPPPRRGLARRGRAQRLHGAGDRRRDPGVGRRAHPHADGAGARGGARPSTRLRMRYGIGPDEFVVGSFGLLTREKRVDTVARAVARAASIDPRVRLLVVGPVAGSRARSTRGWPAWAWRRARSSPAASPSPSWPRTSSSRTRSPTSAIRPRARPRPRCCACSPRAGPRSWPTSRTWRTCRATR